MISFAQRLTKESPYPVAHQYAPACKPEQLEPYGLMDFIKLMSKFLIRIRKLIRGE